MTPKCPGQAYAEVDTSTWTLWIAEKGDQLGNIETYILRIRTAENRFPCEDNMTGDQTNEEAARARKVPSL